MTDFCGLLTKVERLIVAIDAVADNEKLTLEFIKSRWLQEEQRMLHRKLSSSGTHLDSALLNKSCSRARREFSHCRRAGHLVSRCWNKYLHLRPNHKSMVKLFEKNVGDLEFVSATDDHFCLFAHRDLA